MKPLDRLTLEERIELERETTGLIARDWSPGPIQGDYEGYFSSGRHLCYRMAWKFFGSLEGKTVLECGCGDGHRAVLMARNAKETHCFDVSGNAIEHVRRLGEINGVADRLHPAEMAFERLTYPDSHFDVAFGSAVLHHVLLEPARENLLRVLKRGGKAFFVEPLRTNPALAFARAWLPYPGKDLVRGTDRPMSLGEIRSFTMGFSQVKITPIHLFGMLETRFSLEERTKNALRDVDRALLRAAPGLGTWCQMAAIELVK